MNRFGPIQMTQDNLPMLRFLTESHLQRPFFPYKAVFTHSGDQDLIPVSSHYSAYHTTHFSKSFQIPSFS